MTAVAAAPQVSVAHRDMANAIRFLAADAVEKAKSGHPGMPMGMADVATVLYTRFLKFDAAAPRWPDRDRFVLSAGHGSMLLYAIAYLAGYADIDLEQIKNFRQLGSRTAGHPEYGHASIAETTTGPLGQGLGNAVGMALAEKMLAARFGREIVDHYTYVIAGDGCLMKESARRRFRSPDIFAWGASSSCGTTTISVSMAIPRWPLTTTRSNASRPRAGTRAGSMATTPTRLPPRSPRPENPTDRR